jgi:hypothetical protein
MIKRPVHAHDAAALALSIAAVAIACAGVLGGWPPADVSRAVLACSSAAVLVRRRDGAGPGGAIAVALASEAPSIVQAAAMAR